MLVVPPEPLPFAEAGRVPASGDNVAIAVRTLPAGSRVLIRQLVFEISFTVLEGHRFAIYRIRKGDPLLSWGLPFGLATRDIEPGEYICNEKILRALADRHVDFNLPSAANFLDYRLPFELDAANFKAGNQVSAPPPHPTFQGFVRNPRRGAGTRNCIVILGVNSRTGPFARAVANKFKDIQKEFPNVDAVVPVEHTEGGTASRPNNFELTVRTLAGFIVNPNVGAVLSADLGAGGLSNETLRAFLKENDYPVEGLIHEFLTIESFEEGVERAASLIQSWLPRVNSYKRTQVPISHLRLGLQCGGSDAFSGVSANPLVGIVSRETVAHGGSANLAETTELIGAESDVLSNVRDFSTAEKFIGKRNHYQEWAAVHGHSAEGNPSGGNMYRGLYNISIKSIGAARKKDPATRLDYVIDFGERMSEPGFYFMDSPGNDLESIAGQVAAGCNLILFTTGNGSITNFPFVPTIKIMTTTQRFELVRNEMDFNAGRYQEGESLEDLGREAFDYMLEIASGKRSAGERAGHSQVQLWREWRSNRSGPTQLETRALETAKPDGHLIELARTIARTSRKANVALILPTSLCAGQIALMIAEKLNQRANRDFDRAIALPHTEGCGNSGGESERLFLRTMAGYLAHPFISRGLLLEHGCEKTHNDAFRNMLRELNLPESRFGFRSIQLDGGIESVIKKSLEWFELAEKNLSSRESFSVGWLEGQMPETVAKGIALGQLALSEAGVTNVLTSCYPPVFGSLRTEKLEYGERFTAKGNYTMDCQTDDDIEIITGLAATGVEMIVTYQSQRIPGNPLVPTLHIGPAEAEPDVIVTEKMSAEEVGEIVLTAMLQVRRNELKPLSVRQNFLSFQVTRGREGISL